MENYTSENSGMTIKTVIQEGPVNESILAEEAVNESLITKEAIIKGLKQPASLLFILHELQEKIGFISEDSIYQVSESLAIPRPEIISVVTFHRQFKLKRKNEPEVAARNIIRVCSGTPCYSKGSKPITEKLCEMLGIQRGEATKDKRYLLEESDCMGVCAMAPAMMINEDIHGELTAEKLPEILGKYK